MSDFPALLQPLKDRLAAQSEYEYGCQIGGLIYPHDSEAAARRDARFEGNSKRIALRRLSPGRWESVDLPKQADQAKLIAAIEAVAALHPYSGGHLPEQLRSETCPGCLEIHPCPTVAAITQALGGDTA